MGNSGSLLNVQLTLPERCSFSGGNTFIVKWNDRSLDADAYVMFCLDNTGKANGMTMEAISPLTDFSYDFQDLDFSRYK